MKKHLSIAERQERLNRRMKEKKTASGRKQPLSRAETAFVIACLKQRAKY